MKYYYKVKKVVSHFMFDFFQPLDNVCCFLGSDIQYTVSSAKFYINLIDQMHQKKSNLDQIIGNSYELEIGLKITKIINLFAEDEDFDTSCTIETEELRKLIILWMTEVEKFSKIKQSNIFKSIDPEYKIYFFLASIYHQFVDNFDLLLDQYLSFETAEFHAQLIAAIEQFLQSSESVVTKNEYIQLCADSVHFDQLNITPVAWLEIILQYLKKSKNCSQYTENTVST